MGRTIIVEEKVGDYISSLYGNYQWQLGIIIGQFSPQREYILRLSRTPMQSESELASLEDIENSWITEHSRQVSRMLTGGLDVIGIFAFGPTDMLSNSQTKLRQLLFSINKNVQNKAASYFDGLSCSRVLLQICSATKKITFRTVDVSDLMATPYPAEVKYQSFASKWLQLETTLSLPNCHLAVPRKLERSRLQNQIVGSMHSILQNIANALCSVNGELRADEQVLSTTRKDHAKSKTTQTFSIDMFTEGPCAPQKLEDVETAYSLSLSGSMCCRAYVHQKATVKEALQALKYDVVRSVLSRLEVLCDDIIDNQDDNTKNETLSASTWTCPQRVFSPLGVGLITVCDYVFKDETLKESLERISDLLEIKPKEEDLECKEKFPDVHTVTSLMEERENEDRNEETENEVNEQGIGKRVIGAVAGLFVALVATAVTFLWGENTG